MHDLQHITWDADFLHRHLRRHVLQIITDLQTLQLFLFSLLIFLLLFQDIHSVSSGALQKDAHQGDLRGGGWYTATQTLALYPQWFSTWAWLRQPAARP